jgi:predicted  nucleic acid-binding Zn-ribbon protein
MEDLRKEVEKLQSDIEIAKFEIQRINEQKFIDLRNEIKELRKSKNKIARDKIKSLNHQITDMQNSIKGIKKLIEG